MWEPCGSRVGGPFSAANERRQARPLLSKTSQEGSRKPRFQIGPQEVHIIGPHNSERFFHAQRSLLQIVHTTQTAESVTSTRLGARADGREALRLTVWSSRSGWSLAPSGTLAARLSPCSSNIWLSPAQEGHSERLAGQIPPEWPERTRRASEVPRWPGERGAAVSRPRRIPRAGYSETMQREYIALPGPRRYLRRPLIPDPS